jgi:stress response protein YsnF
MRQTIVGLFDTTEEARKAENKLMERGFDRSRIDVSRRSQIVDLDSDNKNSNNKNNDDSDSIGNFFRSLFGSDHEDSSKYSRVANDSDSIVTVHADSRNEAEQAADILDEAGAIDIDDRARQYGFGGTPSHAGYNKTGTATDTPGNFNDNKAGIATDAHHKTNDHDSNTASMKEMEEDVQVGKRTVQTGGARLRSRIVERPVEEHLRLRKEHVTVNRKPVDRVATGSEREAFKEEKIEFTEKAEVPVVSKDTRVTEEVSLNKKVDVKDTTIRETARKTEVDVEQLDENEEFETSDSNHGNSGRRY